MGSFKHQKIYEHLNGDDFKDKISNLPDCMLHHILSFLPTKDAVATCILSTRWKYLWTSVPTIDFDDSLLYLSQANGWYPLEVTCFMNFVERVLLLRDVSTMKRFRLSCRVCFSSSRVHAWVSAAIKHTVQELDLCLFVDKPFMLPHCVFDCGSLTVLKIEMNCALELPASISFPRLRTLHLVLVTFSSNESTQKLFSSCPVLQELAMLDCEWMNLNSITISIPSLKSFVIDDLPCFDSNDDLHGCAIKIEATSLISLKYIGYLSNQISLYNLSSLVDAYIHIPVMCERRKEIAFRAVNLLSGLHNACSVRISNSTIESLFLADNVVDHLPVLPKLTHLVLSMEIENRIFGKLMKFLHYSPNLESIYFAEGLDSHMGLGEDEWILVSVPTCLSYCLKTASLQNFHGNNLEISFLKILLKNALVLEKLNIYRSRNPLEDPKTQKELRKQLQMLPRGSPGCVIAIF